MKTIFFYITVFICLVTILGAESLIESNPILLGIFIVACAILAFNCTILLTEEDYKRYTGWNLYCKLFKFDDQL